MVTQPTPEQLTDAYRAGYTLISDKNPHAAGSPLWAAWQTGRSARHDTDDPKTGREHITRSATADGRVLIVLAHNGGTCFYQYTAGDEAQP